ncbi:MAG: ABC transporter substrate-binding protein [Candidatus Sumerlaeaceae bacterium]|nr:ABC transporter substrate-binding protein [Candidatus Sumerlaeaceae bacterium]
MVQKQAIVTFGLALTASAFAVSLLGVVSTAQSQNKSFRRVRVGLMPTLTHAPAIIATAEGKFERAFAALGYGFEPVILSSGPAIMEALFAQRVDLAYVGPGPAINGFVRSAGKEVAIISGCSANGVAIVVRQGAAIANAHDLAGKRVAVPALGNTQFLSATAWLNSLSKVAGSEAATRVIPCSSSDAQILLKKGQVDAAWLPEPWPSQLEAGGEAVFLTEEKTLWPEGRFPATVVVASRRFLDENPQIVAEFLRVHEETVSTLQTEKERYIPILAGELGRLTKKSLSEKVLSRALQRIDFSTEVMRPQIERFYQLSLDCGFLRRAANVQVCDMFAEIRRKEDHTFELMNVGHR